MNIDESLLNRVVKNYGYASKTEAVEMALRGLDQGGRFRELGKRGMGMTPDELGAAVAKGYDPVVLRVAETPVRYGK